MPAMELTTEKYFREQELNELKAPQPDQSTTDDDHPTVYIHERCGGATEMPASIRRNYLADPCYYINFLGTVCAHCGGPVPDEQLHWEATGESLVDYNRRLRKNKSTAYHVVRFGLPLLIGLIFTGASALRMIEQGDPVKPVGFVLATFFFAAIAWLPCRFIRFFMCRMKLL